MNNPFLRLAKSGAILFTCASSSGVVAPADAPGVVDSAIDLRGDDKRWELPGVVAVCYCACPVCNEDEQSLNKLRDYLQELNALNGPECAYDHAMGTSDIADCLSNAGRVGGKRHVFIMSVTSDDCEVLKGGDA